METPKFSEPKPVSDNFFPINYKLITKGVVTVPVYREFDGKYVKIANDPRDFEEVFKKKKFGNLYISSDNKSQFYEAAATGYLQNLREKLNDPESKEKEIAGLVVDWTDICLGEMMKADSNLAVKHLQTFVNDFLTGFKTKNLNSLMSEVQKFDYSTAQHSIETMALTINYFNSLPQQSRRLNELGAMAALLHDVGKQKVDTSIILKPGSLTDSEFDEIKKHPDYGMQIVAGIDFKALGFNDAEKKLIIDAITQHHEREDGTGYPNNLKSEQISDFGKILAIIDVYSAVTSNTRAYRVGVKPPLAVNMLEKDVKNGKLNEKFLTQFILSLHSLGIDTNESLH